MEPEVGNKTEQNDLLGAKSELVKSKLEPRVWWFVELWTVTLWGPFHARTG